MQLFQEASNFHASGFCDSTSYQESTETETLARNGSWRRNDVSGGQELDSAPSRTSLPDHALGLRLPADLAPLPWFILVHILYKPT